MKIIIVGAGISGLSTYLLLRKHLLSVDQTSEQHEIVLYEAYDVHKLSWNPDPVSAASSSSGSGSEAGAAPGEPDKNLQNTAEPIFTPQAIGSAIGISRNGLNVLARLDDADGAGVQSALIREMATKGHPIERWKMGTARGWTLVDVNLVPRDQRDGAAATTTNQKVKREEEPGEDDRFMYHGVMIARQACWEILRDRVLAVAEVKQRRVVDVKVGDGERKNLVVFEDGGEEQADLVIGADGLRSVVRKAMFTDDEGGDAAKDAGQGAGGSWLGRIKAWLPFFRSSKTAKVDYVTPHYEGLVGFGGFVPSSILEAAKHQPGTMSILFGPNGFFGHGYITSAPPSDQPSKSQDDSSPQWMPEIAPPGPLSGWWSTFASPNPFPFAHPSSPESTKPYSFDKPRALESLLARHRKWKNPALHGILKFVEQDTAQHGVNGKGLDAIYPTWTTPELPYWAKGSVVLLGDAAHALQPSSGQGACQGLEDAEALALLLKHYAGDAGMHNSEVGKGLQKALERYQRLRMPRVHAIYERSQKMSGMKSDMGVVMEFMMYGIIYAMTWFHDDYNEKLLKYDLPSEVEKIVKDP